MENYKIFIQLLLNAAVHSAMKYWVEDFSASVIFSIFGPKVIFFGPFDFIYLVIQFRSNDPASRPLANHITFQPFE